MSPRRNGPRSIVPSKRIKKMHRNDVSGMEQPLSLKAYVQKVLGGTRASVAEAWLKNKVPTHKKIRPKRIKKAGGNASANKAKKSGDKDKKK